MKSAPQDGHTEKHPRIQPVGLLFDVPQEDIAHICLPEGARLEKLSASRLPCVLSIAREAEFVVAPLIGREVDAVEFAAILRRGGFCGHYIVLTPTLPCNDLVLQEILQTCPGLTVELAARKTH
ncbi:hypothetical protein C8N32_105172 [Rhodovulum imhoffii]|uniref:Uncharacterized protein n=1 Tax=Rhodovulum imhoffii TaxID=365340 RepID=A0A2T5BTV8_9RHOB|nr:hypothetical protein [Rhodovulum imhoffii]MBK5934127.1 hypothetical protein [Rhodovulum imhoffii]PTN02799.1 hypothetical protein C8N32_105172 [Rhodovulum imhoffii]